MYLYHFERKKLKVSNVDDWARPDLLLVPLLSLQLPDGVELEATATAEGTLREVALDVEVAVEEALEHELDKQAKP